METAHAGAPSADAAETVCRKIAWRIVPLLFLLYVIACPDRANVRCAMRRMSAAPGFSETVSGLAAGRFLIGNGLLRIPSSFALEKFGARLRIARIPLLGGILAAVFSPFGAPGGCVGPSPTALLRGWTGPPVRALYGLVLVCFAAMGRGLVVSPPGTGHTAANSP
ncbi:MAG: hypothetical protein U1F52_05790 [Burkholderiales bacterium]